MLWNDFAPNNCSEQWERLTASERERIFVDTTNDSCAFDSSELTVLLTLFFVAKMISAI